MTICVLPQPTLWLAGLQFQVAHWPLLTSLTIYGNNVWSGNFRLQHWPLLEVEPLRLPSLTKLYIFVRSDAVGMRQVDDTIRSLMLSTSGSWQTQTDESCKFSTGKARHVRTFSAEVCHN